MRKSALVFSLFLLAACTPEEKPAFHGYVEGEYLYIAPTTAGLLSELLIARGQEIKKGTPLFALDATDLNAKRASAKSEIAQAEAKLNNLLKGERPEEVEIILKKIEQAQAEQEKAEKEYERAKKLLSVKAISQSDYDSLEAAYKTALATLAQTRAELKVAHLGAREEEIRAAQAALDMTRENLVRAEKELKDSAPYAPADSYVEDTFYRKGEYVGAGSPVVSLLPPENIKVRFFVPQKDLPSFQEGARILISCDGCKNSIAAKISSISSKAEYSPPVIYSVEARQKLVYMIEAQPEETNKILRPGLPVDISREGP